jgi:3-oxoacyl-[acyl-carrier-protein] synthase III
MALSKFDGIEIQGIHLVLPQDSESNLDLMSAEEAANFKEKTGILNRKIDNAEFNPILAYFEQGISDSLSETQWDKQEVEVLICVTQTADIAFPSLANRLHGLLNLHPNCICFDINLGCSGYVYGLQLVHALLQASANPSAKALLCVGDISSRFIPKENTGLRSLFSDAVSVTALAKTSSTSPSFFHLESYGSGASAIHAQWVDAKQEMVMDGLAVLKYSVQSVPRNMLGLLGFAQVDWNSVDYVVCHQANQLINELIRRGIKVEPEHYLYSLDLLGNTSSASIPATLVTRLPALNKSINLLISGFGVGFSIASGIITLHSSCKLGSSVFKRN